MDKLTYALARMKALTVAAEEGLHIDRIEFDQETQDFFVYGVMVDLDPDTYQDGKSPMLVRVTNGKITLVDGQ
jgi:hypothetical protein